MNCWDATLQTPAANIAADEALLNACENGGPELLRFWEPTEYFVVLGYSNVAAREANLEACRREKIPVLRRCSGGGAILQGPGCLNYTLILRIDTHESLRTIPGANCHIMERQRDALSTALRQNVTIEGITDLCIDGRKFSGNAQRRLRHALIFHGALLLNFDLPRIEQFLAMPSRQPVYRKNRPHDTFLTNCGASASDVKMALVETWAARDPLTTPPDWQTLASERYSRETWNLAR